VKGLTSWDTIDFVLDKKVHQREDSKEKTANGLGKGQADKGGTDA
jgi:hypothetical protein